MKASRPIAATLCAATLVLTACVAVPVGPEGQLFVYPPGVPPGAIPLGGSQYSSNPAPQFPALLHARLYPANEAATQTGVITGTVTNMMTGKGRFQLHYMGETLTGEATRVDGDARRGVASAYSPSGTFMSCEYQMNTPRQGAGNCTLSNGAQYKVHIGT
jgi:hypothetical protein